MNSVYLNMNDIRDGELNLYMDSIYAHISENALPTILWTPL